MRLFVEGAGTPELPLRLLNLLAQHDALVEHAALDLERGNYRILLDTRPVAPERGALIVEKIRAMVLVSAVTLFDREDCVI